MCGGDCGREGRKYKEPLSTRGKGKGMGRFPKLTSEILSGGKRALPPPKGLASGYFLFLLLGASDRHWRLSGPQSPRQHIAKSQLLQLSIEDRLTVERGLARGRRRPAGSGTADPSKASPCSPTLGAYGGLGVPDRKPRATERKPRFIELKQRSKAAQLESVRVRTLTRTRNGSEEARGVHVPRCPIRHSPRRSSGMCENRGRKRLPGSPNRRDGGARASFPL